MAGPDRHLRGRVRPAFAIEGIAFFIEAILIAIYIYGWRRLRPWTHFWLGFPIPFVALIGAFSIISANSWMNTPAGFMVASIYVVGWLRGRRDRYHRLGILILFGRYDPETNSVSGGIRIPGLNSILTTSPKPLLHHTRDPHRHRSPSLVAQP